MSDRRKGLARSVRAHCQGRRTIISGKSDYPLGEHERDCDLCEAAALLEADMCSVCAGEGKPLSGGDCICGGTGTIYGEMAGLRDECIRLRGQANPVRTNHERE